MMLEETRDEGPTFSPDFAARVLAEADAIAVRRRRSRWIAGLASAAAIVCGLAAVEMWRVPVVPFGAERIPTQISGIGVEEMYSARGAQMEPMDFMFPEAAPLARFMDRYGAGSDTIEDDAVFFPDAADDAEVEVDGS
jgi:hypothetical protein